MCNICTNVLRDPRLTECCGQHYCESCLTRWLNKKKSKTCPHCREVDFVHIRNKNLKRQIVNLDSYCANKHEGCMWRGKLEDLQNHLESDTGCSHALILCPKECGAKKFKRKDLRDHQKLHCALTVVKCPNGCLTRELTAAERKRQRVGVFRSDPVTELLRKDLQQHLTESCCLRRSKCEHCGHEDTSQAITGKGFGPQHVYSPHYPDCCPNALVDCPNSCGTAKTKRKDMPNHQSVCPLEPLQCPNGCLQTETKQGGVCPTIMSRKDLAKHLSNTCYLRPYACEHCGLKQSFIRITGKGGPDVVRDGLDYHYSSCSSFPIDCPNKCGKVKIKRKDIPTHREQCPLEPVQCPLQEEGCKAKLLRKELDDHMATQIQQHLLLTLQSVRMLRKKCSDIERRNADLESKLQSVKPMQSELQ